MANIKIIIERLRGGSSELLNRKQPPRGIIARQFEDDLYGRRRNKDDDDGGGGGGDLRAAPILTVHHYRDSIVSAAFLSGYGYVEHHRFDAAFVDSSRRYAQKWQVEISLNSDFSNPFYTNEFNLSSRPQGFSQILCGRNITCIGETDEGGNPLYRYGIYGTTQYVRARDYDGFSWSLWGSVNLVYEIDYYTSTGEPYDATFVDRCN